MSSIGRGGEIYHVGINLMAIVKVFGTYMYTF